jgi:hypothetical protein
MKKTPQVHSITAPRYAANGNPALLVWAEGNEWRGTPASVVDFGFEGCLLRVDRFPPRDAPAWLCLAATGPAPWIEATVAMTARKGRFSWTRRLVQMRFLEPCPYDVFKAAVRGFSQDWTLPEFTSSRFSEREWR